MGEAKRREDLGPTRKIRFTRNELLDVISFLVPQQSPDNPQATAAQKKINRDTRRPLRSALRQLGILEIWYRAKQGPIMPGALPEYSVCEVTVDAINTLLTLFNVDMDYRETLNIGEIEDRLEDAKAGIYVLPEEPTAPEAAPVAEEPAPASAPELVSVPPATE